MPKNWALGLTKKTDKRVAHAALGHIGLKYSRHKPLDKKRFPWTAELAYAVGLIATDGSLSKNRRHIDFTSKDITLIKTFKKILNLKNKIGEKSSGSTKKKDYFRIQFGNVDFYNWLLKIGLYPNKSKTLASIKIPDRYFFDFIRGCFDGDGNYRSFQDSVWKNSTRIYSTLASASKQNLFWIQSTITRLTGIRGSISYSSNCFRLSFAKSDSLKLFPRIYYEENLPRLERKYIIVNSILEKAEVAKSENAQD